MVSNWLQIYANSVSIYEQIRVFRYWVFNLFKDFFFGWLKNAKYEDEQFENTDLKMLTKNNRSSITY
jgi:hypothetical protein